MGAEKFDLQVGASGDVHELEYISALHQTGDDIRLDGSIQSSDIRLFLSSRYGIEVEEKQVHDTILHGLGGGSDKDKTFDLVEVVSCLLIPTFLKMEHQYTENPLPHFVMEANPDLLKTVLRIILNDVTGSGEPQELTPDLVRKILEAYGEHELAGIEDLVEEMTRLCKGHEHLDEAALVQALTSDVKLFDLANEGTLSTNLNDVFTTNPDHEDGTSIIDVPLDESEQLKHFSIPLKRKHTRSHIDVTAGTFRSKPLIVLLWATFAISYFTFSFEVVNTGLDQICGIETNVDTLVCESLLSIVRWLFYFVGMAVLGLLYVSLGSAGNSVYCSDWKKPILGAAAVWIPVAVLFFAFKFQVKVDDSVEVDINQEDEDSRFLANLSLTLASVTAVYHLFHAAYLGFPAFRKIADVNHRLMASSVYDEMRLKMSAAHKLHSMTTNALEIFEEAEKVYQPHTADKFYSRLLQSYAKHNSRTEQAGGLFWAWKRILRLDPEFLDEGMWVSARLVASNVAQWVVALYILFYGSRLLRSVSEDYVQGFASETARDFVFRSFNVAADIQVSEATIGNVTSIVRSFLSIQASASGIDFGCDEVSTTAQEILSEYCTADEIGGVFNVVCDQSASINYVCPLLAEDLTATEQIALLTGAGFQREDVQRSILSLVNQTALDTVDSLYPNNARVILVPVGLAIVFAFITTAYLALVYLPSIACTMLKLRRGGIATLRNPRFFKVRRAADLVAILTGSLFWGALGSAAVVGITIGLVAFFFMWHVTAYYAQKLVAIIVGLVGITLIRTCFLVQVRKKFFRCLYRESPGPANLVLLGLEWAYFSLTAGFIAVRMVKLLFCAAVNVGRIDTPFLASGVGRLGNIELDHYHLVNLQDILFHEAHRHPYIELLGVIYMMKMRHGDNFGCRAGSCWRLIFVQALMPWLQQYRILAQHPDSAEQRENSQSLPASFLSFSHPNTYDGTSIRPYVYETPNYGQSLVGEQQGSESRIHELEEQVKNLKAEIDRLSRG